jgi:hypothetical protein
MVLHNSDGSERFGPMKRLSGTSFLVAASLALLSACGGGDDDPDARIVPTFDSPPTFDAPPACTAITLGGMQAFAGGNADVLAWGDTVTNDLGDGGDSLFQIEFYNGLQPGPLMGTFQLDEGIDANYATCASCVRLFSFNAAGDMVVRQFFQSSGSITLTEDPFTNQLMIGSLDDVTLVEVTIADDFTSTPVPGGECLSLGATVALDADTIPLAWTCPDAAYGDGATCDCMCGAIDPDCSVPANPINGCTAGQVCTDGICETPPPPPVNDSCPATVATATNLVIGVPTTGTTLGATDDFNDGLNACTGFDQPGGDVVYRIVLAPNQAITVSLTGADPSFDSAIAIIRPGSLAGCNAEPVNCQAGADATLAGEDETFTFTAAAAGGPHWIIVDAYAPGVAGNFTLTVTSP